VGFATGLELGARIRRAAPLLALLLIGAPAPAGAGALQGPGGLALSGGAGRFRLEAPGGEGRAIELPGGGHPEVLVETSDGWVAAGTVVRPEGADLYLVRERAGRIETLEPPRGAERSLRGGGVPLVSGGRLAGLSWLEGDAAGALAVRAAAWDGGGWLPTATVAAAGDQVALRGAVLGDGSWLLVWARVKDGDSDLVWSRRDAAGWSAPRPLAADNAVPDILPAVAATPDGRRAVAAWSRYDGDDYRLRLARFDGETWRELPLDSERGAGDPSFVTVDGALHLLYKAVVPDRWSVLRLDGAGRPLARGAVAEPSYARPRLGPGPTLWWSGGGAGEPRRSAPVRLEERP